MEYAGSSDASGLLLVSKRVESLIEERRSMERNLRGLTADAMDAGMCVRSLEFGWRWPTAWPGGPRPGVLSLEQRRKRLGGAMVLSHSGRGRPAWHGVQRRATTSQGWAARIQGASGIPGRVTKPWRYRTRLEWVKAIPGNERCGGLEFVQTDQIAAGTSEGECQHFRRDVEQTSPVKSGTVVPC